MIAKADRRDAWVGLSSAPADDLKRALVGYGSDSTRAKWRALRSARISAPKTRLTEPTLSETLIDGWTGHNYPLLMRHAGRVMVGDQPPPPLLLYPHSSKAGVVRNRT